MILEQSLKHPPEDLTVCCSVKSEEVSKVLISSCYGSVFGSVFIFMGQVLWIFFTRAKRFTYFLV